MMRPNMQRHICHYPNNGDTWGVEVPIKPRTKILFGNKKKNVKMHIPKKQLSSVKIKTQFFR